MKIEQNQYQMYAFRVDIIQFTMVDFGVILGMYLLAKNHARVDCDLENVKLQTPNLK